MMPIQVSSLAKKGEYRGQQQYQKKNIKVFTKQSAVTREASVYTQPALMSTAAVVSTTVITATQNLCYHSGISGTIRSRESRILRK